MTGSIDLIYFQGCPNAERARDNLRAALERAGVGPEWSEWDLESDGTPDDFRRFGSPTVLVAGRDVTGDEGRGAAMACRADGAPSVETILGAVQDLASHG